MLIGAPPETVYGTGKKLRLIAATLGAQCTKQGRRPREVWVLDVGCGTGAAVSVPLARLGYRVVGLDPDERSVRSAVPGAPEGLAGTVSFVAGDVRVFRPHARFDAIVCSEVLEHLASPETLLRQCRQLLRAGGRLVITVPNGYGGFEWEEVLWRRLGFRVVGDLRRVYLAVKLRIQRRQFRTFFRRGLNADLASGIPINTHDVTPHVQFFTLARLQALLEATGFRLHGVANLSLLSGKITNTLLGRSAWFVRWTTTVADRVPSAVCSGWLVVCEPAP